MKVRGGETERERNREKKICIREGRSSVLLVSFRHSLVTLCPHLQFLAVLVEYRHGDLHVLGRSLAAFIEISLDQSHVDVIPHVTCWGGREEKTLQPGGRIILYLLKVGNYTSFLC